MNRAFESCHATEPSTDYDGTIARLLGDAMLVFFGAPVAHEDDPVRAVRASLDMLDAVREYAEEVRAKHGIEFRGAHRHQHRPGGGGRRRQRPQV